MDTQFHLMINNMISEEDRHVHLLTDALEQVPPAPEHVHSTASVARPDHSLKS
jgi:hypothetical protein